MAALIAVEPGAGVTAIVAAHMMSANIGSIAVHSSTRTGMRKLITIARNLCISLTSRLCWCHRYGFRDLSIGQPWLVLALIEILDQKLDDIRSVIGKVNGVLLGFLRIVNVIA
jgi:hypothetical protein